MIHHVFYPLQPVLLILPHWDMGLGVLQVGFPMVIVPMLLVTTVLVDWGMLTSHWDEYLYTGRVFGSGEVFFYAIVSN